MKRRIPEKLRKKPCSFESATVSYLWKGSNTAPRPLHVRPVRSAITWTKVKPFVQFTHTERRLLWLSPQTIYKGRVRTITPRAQAAIPPEGEIFCGAQIPQQKLEQSNGTNSGLLTQKLSPLIQLFRRNPQKPSPSTLHRGPVCSVY